MKKEKYLLVFVPEPEERYDSEYVWFSIKGEDEKKDVSVGSGYVAQFEESLNLVFCDLLFDPLVLIGLYDISEKE